MPAEDVVIEGVFIVNNYAVTYKVDGVEYAVDSVAYGSEVVLREHPVKEGHTFGGWSEAPTTMPAEDITIEGTFTVNTYNVIYKVDGEEYYVVPLSYGSEITLIEVPVKEGYTFSGWSEAPATMPASDVTIEGAFAVNNYVITYIVDGELYRTETVAYNSEIPVVESPTKIGHSFTEWIGLPYTMPAADITVEANFVVNSYVVNYIVDGTGYEIETVAYNSHLSLIEEPVKEGYTFSGWKTKGWTGEYITTPIDLASNADEMLSSNTSSKDWAGLLKSTYYSGYTSDGSNAYIRVDLGAGNEVGKFTFAYSVPNMYSYQPTEITITGSNEADGDYTIITTLTELPQENRANYNSEILGNGNRYRYIRYNMHKRYFWLSEFSMTRYEEVIGLIMPPTAMPASDITVEGSFAINSYAVIYKVDGVEYAVDSVAYGSDVVLREYPTKIGHTFSGWSDVPATMPAEDITVEGGFSVNSYNIIYKVDGEEYETVPVVYGTPVTLLASPTKEGHSFSGWRREQNENPGAFPIDIASNADNMLYTNAYCTNTTWGDEFKGWHVLFDGNDGTFFHSEYANVESSDALDHYLRVDLGAGNEIEKFSFTYRTRKNYSINSPTKIVVEGSNIADGLYTEIAVLTGLPTNNSTYESDMLSNGNRYRFIRFRVTETSSNQKVYNHPFFYISEFGMTRYVDVMSIPEIMPAEDVVIEGEFTVNKYAVIYKVDGVELAVDSVAYGSDVVLREHPAKEGYTFSGWSEAPTTMPAEDVTIEGSFAVNYYAVTYMVDGEVYATDSIAYSNEVILREEPTKEGHTFSGWSEAPATMPTGDVTIEGTFAVNYYAVTYKVDGEVYATDSIAYSNEVILREEPTKEGHTFSGWSEAPATMPTGDVTIEGTFAVNYYAVTYKVDGEVYATDSIAYSNEVILREEPTKEGHTFSGWSEAPATMPAEDVTIEGSFAVNYYAVTYKIDGEVYATDSIAYSNEVILREEPTKEGHTFSGWSEAPATMPAEDVTIEGSFAVNYYAVTYKIDGEVYATDSIAYGKEIVTPEHPVKEGYTFGGWSDVPQTMPAEDIEITSSFVVNGYKVIYIVDGVEYQSELVEYGSVINLPKFPIKEGYTFSGWQNVPESMPAEDITIEGIFTVNTYNVIYKVDGEEYQVVPVTYCSEITLIEAPTKEGHTFSGWSEAPATMPASDITIEGSFAVNNYTVTYLVDGEVYATETVAYGSEIVLIDAPTKEGYTFSGWSEAPATMPASDVTIEGSFTVNTYNVIYKVDGEEYQVVPVTYGSEITLLDEPTKEGHTFSGWSEAPAIMPANDITIEGIFTVNNYTVTYLVDGEVYATETVAYGGEIILRDEPVKEGHTFSGWSEAPATMPASDVTINGVFTVNTYNVIYKVDGEEYQVVPVTYGSEITLIEAPTKEGHTFSGWSEAPATMPAEDVTINGVFTVNTYNVIYKVDGEEYQVVPVTYGSEITLIDAPTKEGHTFSGWSEAPATMPAGDVTIEGSFTVNSYNVIYKVDGEEYQVVPVTYGSEITLIDAPTKEGHTFSGWSEAPATMPAGDVTIEGSFTVNSYNVIYKVDGEEYQVVPVTYGSEITLLDEPTKEGHTFSGWSEVPATMPAEDIVIEGSFAVNTYNVIYKVDGEEYQVVPVIYGSEITLLDEPTKEGHTFSGWSEAPATMPASDVTIEGSFTVNTYNVIYKVDGEEYQVVPVIYGSEITLLDEPTKEGHTFSGWSEVPATMPANDITIEGTFIVNNYTVTYLVDGEVYATETVAYGSEIVLIDAPTKEGHTFSGWSEAPATMPAEDVTINGVFTVNTYNVIYKVDGEEYQVVPVTYGSEITLLDEPTKEGHTFSGWSEAPSTMPANDITIEGTFIVNNYTVTYLVDGEVYATETVAYGSEIVLIDAPTKEGYTFSGWSEAPVTMPAEDIVIEGYFTPVTFINGVECDLDELIIYNLKGERVVDTDELERGFYIINGRKVWVK